VLLLGLDAPEDLLRKSFDVAAPFPVYKGFAVGRSIFGAAARAWFAGEMDDNSVIELIAGNYARMIAFWRTSQEQT
jgi:5-dehydro-2-deoxygluconokinase